jgi:hypothetical protein
MPAFRTLPTMAAAILFLAMSGQAHAQTSPDIEKQQKKTVSRLYQLIYETQDRCRASTQAARRLGKATADFRAAFPELMRLVDQSPHLASAQERSRKELADLKKETSVEDCTMYASFIRQFIDAPNAKEAMAKSVELLKK